MRYYDMMISKGKFASMPINFTVLPYKKNGESYYLLFGVNQPQGDLKHGDKTPGGWLMVVNDLPEVFDIPIRISNSGRAYKTKSGLLKEIERRILKK